MREMREMKRFLTVCLCVMLVTTLMIPETAFAARTAALSSRKSAESVGRAGWYRQKNGKKKYYRDGQYVTGQQKIGKYVYMFSKYGNMIKRDITIHKVRYYIASNGHILAWKKGGKYYTATGKRMNSTKAVEFRAYQNARKVVARITTSDMTDAEKLQRCFVWMQSNGFATQGRLSSGGKFWYAFNANQLFMRRRGNCISYACAMAYMAKVIGYKEVYICSRGTKQQSFHTWTEINGVVYDSYFANRRDADKYYGIKYDDFEYGVVFRQKLPEKYSWLSK